MSNDVDTLPNSTARPPEIDPPLEHVTVENPDEPDECAIFPRDAGEDELETAWIAAQDGAFVDLESVR